MRLMEGSKERFGKRYESFGDLYEGIRKGMRDLEAQA